MLVHSTSKLVCAYLNRLFRQENFVIVLVEVGVGLVAELIVLIHQNVRITGPSIRIHNKDGNFLALAIHTSFPRTKLSVSVKMDLQSL